MLFSTRDPSNDVRITLDNVYSEDFFEFSVHLADFTAAQISSVSLTNGACTVNGKLVIIQCCSQIHF